MENVPPSNAAVRKRKRTSFEGHCEPASFPSPSKRARSSEVTTSSWLRALPAWASGARRWLWSSITSGSAQDASEAVDGPDAAAAPSGHLQAVQPYQPGESCDERKPAVQLDRPSPAKLSRDASRVAASQVLERDCCEEGSEPLGLQDMARDLHKEHPPDTVIGHPSVHEQELHASKLEGDLAIIEAWPDSPSAVLFHGSTGQDQFAHQESQRTPSQFEGRNRRTAKLHALSFAASPFTSPPEPQAGISSAEDVAPHCQASDIKPSHLPDCPQSEITVPQCQAVEIRDSELAALSQSELIVPQQQIAKMTAPIWQAETRLQHLMQIEIPLPQHQALESEASAPLADVSAHLPVSTPVTPARRSSAHMTRLKIEPSDVLRFSDVCSEKAAVAVSFKLLSTAATHVAVKIKTTAPERYDVRPCLVTLKPGEGTEVHVTVRRSNRGSRAKDKFLVQAVDVGAVSFVSREQWAQFAKCDMQQHRLRVADATNH